MLNLGKNNFTLKPVIGSVYCELSGVGSAFDWGTDVANTGLKKMYQQSIP